MDALAQTLMKGAVNCDRHSDLQNSVNQLVVECGIRFGLSLKSCVLHCLGNSHGNMLMMLANQHSTVLICFFAKRNVFENIALWQRLHISSCWYSVVQSVNTHDATPTHLLNLSI